MMESNKQKSYHFIGVGGIGMSGLAELLVRQGHQVSGSDLAAGAITQRLETLGVLAELVVEGEVVELLVGCHGVIGLLGRRRRDLGLLSDLEAPALQAGEMGPLPPRKGG